MDIYEKPVKDVKARRSTYYIVNVNPLVHLENIIYNIYIYMYI